MIDPNTPINTETLQKRFPDVYKSFFAENDIVISSDIVVLLVSGYSWRVGAPGLSQKLNTRLYTGVRPNRETDTIKIGHQLIYDSKLDVFREADYEMLKWKESLPLLKKILLKKTGLQKLPGMTFDFICEMPENRAVDAGVSTNMIAALCLLFKQSTIKEINTVSRCSAKDYGEQLNPSSQLLKKIQMDSTKLRSPSLGGASSGYSDIGSILSSESPFIYLAEERWGSQSSKYKDLEPLCIDEDPTKMTDFKNWFYRINDLLKKTSTPPYDFVSIYPGSQRQYLAHSNHVNKETIPAFDILRDKAVNIFGDIVERETKHLPSFLKEIGHGDFGITYMRGQAIERLKCVLDFVEYYKSPQKSSARYQFFETLNSLSKINSPFVEAYSRNIEEILFHLNERAHKRDIQIGVHLLSDSKEDSNILIFLPHGQFREDIFDVVKKLRENTNEMIHIDYASWRDGWGHEGLKVEQHVSNKLYSPMIGRSTKKLTCWNEKDGTKVLFVSTVNPEDFDILFDEYDKKVFIAGKSTSSKELPSQKAVIEIFAYLFQFIGEGVSNKELPSKTYSSYRNELQGKIMGPLEKLVAERTEWNLGLSISGQLTQFDVTWKPHNLKIGFVSSLHLEESNKKTDES